MVQMLPLGLSTPTSVTTWEMEVLVEGIRGLGEIPMFTILLA